ncbi:unnamed protein product [Symbiodinium pilosum]|uniref:Uncharacterized protein n=1 Tax=Symbiodinium pilosum TaxID=2952 RepID=A0A812VXD0_SYMPI|nr:unnamed protein product [Symbiodinium pilosum]
MTLDPGAPLPPGSTANRRLVASGARCAVWKRPDCLAPEEKALGTYLDLDQDPPADLLLTDDVREVAEHAELSSPGRPIATVSWSRLDQRSPEQAPAAPAAAASGLVSGDRCVRCPPMLEAAPKDRQGQSEASEPEEDAEQKRQRVRDVMMQVFTWLEEDYGTTCGRSRNATYRDGLKDQKRIQTKVTLHMQPGLKDWRRRRGNAVPSTARDAVFSVLQHLFTGYHFEQREVRVEVARPLQSAAGGFRFPRLEASIYGRWSPMSHCCDTAVLTFFDVVCGVCVICLRSTCKAPALQLMPLAEALRVQIWGHWISLNGGVLPKHRPPRPARTRFFPMWPEAGWIPRATMMALLADQDEHKLHVSVELRHPELELDVERSLHGSEPCEEDDDQLDPVIGASQPEVSIEGSIAAVAGETATFGGSGRDNHDNHSADMASERSVSPRPILRRPPSKDAWRARPVTDGQASLLKSKLEELYLEQRFGPLNVQTDKLLYAQACQQPYRDFMGSRGQQGLCTGKAQDDGAAAATETEDLFYLTSEDGTLYSEATPLRGQALQQRPGTAGSTISTPATRSSPAMSRPSSSRPRSAGPGRASLPSGERCKTPAGKGAVPPHIATSAIHARRLGQRWRVLPPKHVRPHHCNLPSVLVTANQSI